MKHNLCPKYARLKNKTYSTPGFITQQQYPALRLKNEVNYLHRKKSFLTLQIYNVDLICSKFFGKHWFEIKMSIINKLSPVIKSKYNTLYRKLETIRNNQHTRNSAHTNRGNFQFHDPVKNLSDIHFTQAETEHIAKGFKSKFQTDNHRNIIDNLIVQSENIIHNSTIENKDEVRHLISREINKLTTHNKTKQIKQPGPENFSKKTFLNTVKKIQDNNLIIDKADKGNIITINTKDNLEDKISTFLSNQFSKK